MVKQYLEIKSQHKDSILFFRLGDFYEMFGDDAVSAAKILNITLTARNRGTPNEMPMCGIPYHAAEGYMARLTRAGKKVAICDQTSDPNIPGIVKREVTRIVTPGTTLDDSLLNNKQNNFIVAIVMASKNFGLAVTDLTTGDFRVTQTESAPQLIDEISRLRPAELLVTPAFSKMEAVSNPFPELKKLYHVTIYNPSAWQSSSEILQSHFKVHSLASFGLDSWPAAVEASGLLMSYLFETQKTSLGHLKKISRYQPSDFMLLDESTIRNLELFQSSQGGQEGSLISVIDYTSTAMGGRLLRQWLVHPLRDAKKITGRLEAVKEVLKDGETRRDLMEELKLVLDIERLLGRVGCLRANARDLLGLKTSLETIPYIRKSLQSFQSENFLRLHTGLKDQKEVVSVIEQAISPEAPLALNEGGIIKEGFNPELDELRKITTQGKEYIKGIEEKEAGRTGIKSLKVKFNTVFGYYIEISKANLESVPQDYIRKQTLVNAERYITPELKEYEEKVLGAQDKMKALEYKIFSDVRDRVARHISSMQETAESLAELDIYISFAQGALLNKYCKPQLREGGAIIITAGRHPVIEKFLSHSYVPNDTLLDDETHRLVILTGPNMSGKSSYLRQIALISLMAQIGSFVPCEKAEVSLVDRIFTRVGASDNLTRGQSTFMVEMQEAANILNNATKDSLIILDELGRGTSTYDGVSIAWAIAEYLHNRVKAKTLFATHYHELIEMADHLACAKNYCVAVKENPDGVVFLHKVLAGGVDRSYGIEVAKLAGLPEEIIYQAKTILRQLEAKGTGSVGQESLPFIENKEHPLLAKVRGLNVDEMTPLQALQKLSDLKNELTDK